MRINWKARSKNKRFWVCIVPTVLGLIYALLGVIGIAPGITLDRATSIGLSIVEALAILGIINDPTTEGFSDSERALTYTKPYREEGQDDEH